MLSGLPPLLLRPHYVAKPWGGRRLATELGRPDFPAGRIGESWEVFDLGAEGDSSMCSLIDGGPFDGQPLRDVLGMRFPLLLKVLDAREHLSVQLHPDGRDGEEVKEEAWVALADGGEVAIAPPGQPLSCPDDGLPPEGGWLDQLDVLPLHAGSSAGSRAPTVVHIPPGTVHAVLAGALLFEVQNPVDVTWRLDDHGRRDDAGAARDLHVDEAGPLLAEATPARTEPDAAGRLAAARFVLDVHPPGEVEAPRVQAVFFTRPGRVLVGEAEPFVVPAGRTVLIPPGTTALRSDGWMIASASL